MRNDLASHAELLEGPLAQKLCDFASDLRLTDVGEFAALIHRKQFGNIASLIASSSERFFLPGTLQFARSGEVVLTWDASPIIILDMEFHFQGVDAYFRLQLAPTSATIELGSLDLSSPAVGVEEKARLLTATLDRARLIAVRSVPGAAYRGGPASQSQASRIVDNEPT
jgi:hypothetical protein